MVSTCQIRRFCHPGNHYTPHKFGYNETILPRDVRKCEILGVPHLYLLHPFKNFSASEGHAISMRRDYSNSFYILNHLNSVKNNVRAILENREFCSWIHPKE
ncbi:hypothetical protein CFOL_v3_14701 [Cephalotus follicularis]|uniref:Uncharacterized protein n=1 Tax=Cephalotus follicularis TaxID=3775 RepID=A0A1Q3BTB7_CEPFO|nr:hypothetical protein CFOL_v3_14701 [Cephalotus follicularis]